MGFIEEERRKQEVRLEDQQRRQSILDQQDKERKQREESEKAAITDRKVQREKAKQQFEQSGLGEMIRELGRIGSHEEVREYDPHNIYPRWSPGYTGSDYRMFIEVSIESKKDKEVSVVVTPDGIININGGLFGSTILPKDEWQGKNGREALEKALGKAYKHPRLRPGTYTDQSTPIESYPGN